MNKRHYTLAAAAAFGALLALAGCSGGGHDSGHEEMPGDHGEMMEHQGAMQGHMGMEETEEHTPAMEAQHETMRTLAEQWAKAKGAALGGDPQDALGPAKKMHEAATHIEGFMLHKNSENRQQFLERAQEFNSLLMRFTTDAKTGNVESLRQSAPDIDRACNDCHQAFR